MENRLGRGFIVPNDDSLPRCMIRAGKSCFFLKRTRLFASARRHGEWAKERKVTLSAFFSLESAFALVIASVTTRVRETQILIWALVLLRGYGSPREVTHGKGGHGGLVIRDRI